MFKHRYTLLLLLVVFFSTFSAAATVMAQAPFVSIVTPGNGAVVDTSNVSVQVSFGNAPEGGGGLLVRAYDSNNNLLGQSATNDLSLIPWSTVVGISATPGSTGYLVASMLDGSGVTVATSPTVSVSYGSAPPPPTFTFTPSITPSITPSATSPAPQATITIVSPTANQVVDPIAGFNVAGSTSNIPAGSIIQVRLRNANGDTLGEQSVVPVSNQPWSVFIVKSQPNVPTTGSGSIVAFVLLNGNFVAQTNVIPLQFSGQPPQASVTITSPTNGSSVNRTNPVIVSGTSTGLPTGTTILIRGFINNGPTLIASGTATTNANGTWSAQIGFGGTPPSGTPGYIVATAVSGNNTLAVSNNVAVIWTGNIPPTNPVIQITFPPSGAVVGANGTLVQVTGTAANLFENSLTVRALDSFGNTLASQPLTYDQNGNWAVNLAVNVAPGTPGSIYAFALSPNNGQVVASARVNVYFGGQCFIRTDLPVYVVQPGDTLNKIASRTASTVGQLALYNCINNVNLLFVGQQLRVPQLPVVATPTQPVQTTLRILTPVQNAVLDPSQRVIVAGSGRALAGNDVVVRVLDSAGNLLTQQTTRVGAPSANGESQWQVSLGFTILNSTQGSIYAFAQNPTTGAILANALVDVTFSAPIIVQPAPETRRLIITQPADNASVTPSGQLQVSGQILDDFDGEIFVRVLDPNGNTIFEVPATVGQPDAQGNATWQALLDVNMQTGIWGTIFVYSPTPFAITPMIADAVNVVFGQANPGPYVTISSPLPYAVIDSAAPFSVSGRGGRLFEGNVVVRALDMQGNVLAETATTVNSPNAGTGGEGDWQTQLSVNVAPGTRGAIVALSTSAQDGSVVAFSSIYVTYGDPVENANFVRINAPLPGSNVDPSQTLMIAGTADQRAGNTVTVQIVDDRGNVLVEQPRNLNPSAEGDFGVWQMLVELRGMSPGTHLRINALTTSRANGQALASDSVDITVGQPSQPVS